MELQSDFDEQFFENVCVFEIFFFFESLGGGCISLSFLGGEIQFILEESCVLVFFEITFCFELFSIENVDKYNQRNFIDENFYVFLMVEIFLIFILFEILEVFLMFNLFLILEVFSVLNLFLILEILFMFDLFLVLEIFLVFFMFFIFEIIFIVSLLFFLEIFLIFNFFMNDRMAY